MAQTNAGAVWTEDPNVAISVGQMYVTETSPGVYELGGSGAVAAQLVADGSGGYVLTIGAVSGTGKFLTMSGNVFIL